MDPLPLLEDADEPARCPECRLPLDDDHTPEVCAKVAAWLAEHRRRFWALDWA